MARIKAAVNAHKKRRKVLKLAKGYYGAKSKQYRAASRSPAAFAMLMKAARCASATSAVCGSPVSTPPLV